MKMRKFLHVLAIMLSSLASMVTHGKAQEAEATPSSRKSKKDGLTRHHRHHPAQTASQTLGLSDPPSSATAKTSRHAATWSSYDSQETLITPPPPSHLDPALMASAERPGPPLVPLSGDALPTPLPGDENSRYPWKRQIVTTTFWIGETPSRNNPVPNRSSCWDPDWAKNYGGNDSPDSTDRTPDYTPAAFTPGQNPFYIALPYNDMEHGGHKAEAAQVIPWFAKDYKGPTKSVCQGRWIAIRFGQKVCYAQWEDAGPFRTDHWQYVFGDERPRWNLNRGAGLDVSPAVRDYLGIGSTDVTDWKFVDFDEVPTGPWAKFGDNNTFVQNARKPGNQVVENIGEPPRSNLHSIPGLTFPISEIR
jgi:hypothetical protein